MRINFQEYMPMVFGGLWVSVYISLISFAFALIVGVIVYLGRAGRPKIFRATATGFVEVLRNVPLLVVLYIIYFGLGQVGLNLNSIWSSILALGLVNGAYVGEILRGGFEAIPKGQREAASALGMSRSQSFIQIELVPAVRNVLPSLTNQFIMTFLFSSVAAVISLPELTNALMQVNAETEQTFIVFGAGAILYFIISTLIAYGSRVTERRLFQW